ncbi:hypothetical protein D3C87_1518070 [compost metagenome]
MDRAALDHPEGYHAADAQGSDLPEAQRHPSVRRRRQRSVAGDGRLECREGAEPDVPPGSGQDQRDVVDEDQLPQRASGLHARHAPAGPVQQADAFRIVRLRSRPERSRPFELAFEGNPRLVAPADGGHDQDRRQHADHAGRRGPGFLHLHHRLVGEGWCRAVPRRHLSA